MPLNDSYDVELARYLYSEYVVKNIQHTYGDTSRALEKITGIYKDPHMALPHNLGRVSEFCFHELDLPLLSIGVYNQSGEIGGGFFNLARKLKPEYMLMSNSDVSRQERKLINSKRETGEWQRLSDYLDGISIEQIMQKFNAAKTDPTFPDENPQMSEGAKKQTLIDIRERNPEARRRCIEHWGAACCVCETDLGAKYGDAFQGKIHVHHLKPIASYDDEHSVDPINDLRPVCPNCHMIIHCKDDEPYTIDEVKGMLGLLHA